ncbi:MAG: ARMT1-like domain-containing protein [Synergistaceae bacterium]|nr:ARMT1-like domain-containing protein [Synergistaceae bacterium]
MDIHKIPDGEKLDILREYNDMLCGLPMGCHVDIAISKMYILLRRRMGIYDPLCEAKREQNAQASALIEAAENMIASQDDLLLGSLKMSCVGNMIDFTFGDRFDVESEMGLYMGRDFALSDYEEFQKKLQKAVAIVLVCDNAGEIIFDRLLLEEIAKWKERRKSTPPKFCVLVKGAPILNDAMMEDAEFAGMGKIAEVRTTGCEYIGAPQGLISPEASDALANADLIIAKGLANFESMHHETKFAQHAFYLFKSKCAPVSRKIGVQQHSAVLLHGKRFA